MTPDEAFCRDIPEVAQEDVMYKIATSAQRCETHSDVQILDRDRMDAINVRASGIIEYNGIEYWFIVSDGNWDGTVLEAWGNTGTQKFEYHVPTKWALQPCNRLVSDAIADGKGPFLIWKWDNKLKNKPEIAAIPGKYAYDIHFQPGGKSERYWRDAAAEHHFDLVTQETADETRKRLEAATEPLGA